MNEEGDRSAVGGRTKKETRSEVYFGRSRSILREKGEELIDGTSVMVQPSISCTYTFIIYYPCFPLRILCFRYTVLLSSFDSFLSFLLRSPPQSIHGRSKGRPVTKQPSSRANAIHQPTQCTPRCAQFRSQKRVRF